MSNFSLHKTEGSARIGTLHTPHGDVPTPAFMPVATQGSVKAVDPNDLRRMGATILLGNTYHLYLRPGVESVRNSGWSRVVHGLERSHADGQRGFQGFSLEHLRNISEDGIEFKSHIDGSKHMFSPESVIRHQEGIGADVIMPIDVCAPGGSDRTGVTEAVELTTRWAERCREAQTRDDQMLFGIVQGGTFPDLREVSVEQITALDFPGYALGGLSVGESKTTCTTRLGIRPHSCLPNGPDTSWASVRRRTLSNAWLAESICSTASCRPESRATARSSFEMDVSTSIRRAFVTSRHQSRRTATATRARRSRQGTSTISSKPTSFLRTAWRLSTTSDLCFDSWRRSGLPSSRVLLRSIERRFMPGSSRRMRKLGVSRSAGGWRRRGGDLTGHRVRRRVRRKPLLV